MDKKYRDIIEKWLNANDSKVVDIKEFKTIDGYQLIIINNLDRYDYKFERSIAKLEIELNNTGDIRFMVVSSPENDDWDDSMPLVED